MSAEQNRMDTITTSKPDRPDYAAAIAYALNRLRAELPPELHYHNVEHTVEDVMPAAMHLAQLSKVADPDLHLLEVAAAFHDIGQIEGSMGHELVGIGVIARVLPQFGFGPDEIDRVAGMILATRLPQTPLNEEQAYLCDADLDSLGREDFFPISKALWRERAACGMVIPWQIWLESQIQFLQSHQYFTPAARMLRQEGKLRNIERLGRLIRGERVPEWTDD